MPKHLRLQKMIKSTRMWIDGTCYSIKPRIKVKENEEHSPEEPTEKQNHELFNISIDDKGKHTSVFRLPVQYYQKLENYKNDIKCLERDTGAEVIIPQLRDIRRMEMESITITGNSLENVSSAREEMHSILLDIRNQYRPAQFIGIPTLSEEIQSNFKKFKEEILNSGEKIKGLEESIFQKGEKLHLTITVFKLLDDVEKEEAVKALNELKDNVLLNRIKEKLPLTIGLQGIDIMNNKQSSADILYANAKFLNEDLSLQDISNEISNYFYDRGLSTEHKNVKLHVTLINTKYRTSKKGQRWNRKPFDATYILNKFKDYNFGVSDFKCIHLSHMSSNGDDGYYKPLSVVSW